MLHRIRVAGPDDSLQMMAIYNKVVTEELSGFNTEVLNQQHMMKIEELSNFQEVALVAEVELVGVIGWIMVHNDATTLLSNGVGEISIYITQEYRGNGIGKLLLNELIIKSKKTGYHKLIAIVLEENIVGLKLYKSSGFRNVGSLLNHCKINGSYKNFVIVEKILAKE